MSNSYATTGRTALPIKVVSDMLRVGARVVSIGFTDSTMIHAMDKELQVVARPKGAVRVFIPNHRLSTFDFPAEEKTFSLSDVVTITKKAKK